MMKCKKGSKVNGRCVSGGVPHRKGYSFTVSDGVVDVGTRLDLVKYLPRDLEIQADNDPNERYVTVHLGGNKDSIRNYYNLIQSKPLGKSTNACFTELKENGESTITNSDRFFHQLQCEQLGKFVDVGLDMRHDINHMSNKMDELITEIREDRKRTR
jgi:hypothetical protein